MRRTAILALGALGLVACGEPQSPASPGAGGAAGSGGASASGGVSASGGIGGTGAAGAIGGAGASSGGAAGAVSAGGAGMTDGGTTSTGGTSGEATGGSAGDGEAGEGVGGSSGGDAGASGAGVGGAGTAGGAGAPMTCADAATLKEASLCNDRLIGVALATAHLGEAAYAEKAREFNYATAEDEMKWERTEATRNQFTFSAGDQVVDFAMQNGMKVKGHTLVWYSQLPGWVSAITEADDLRSAMTNHIQKVMEHYKGKVIAWDVVNEAWDPGDPTMMRDSVFLRVLGPSYVDEAFTAARAADPDAKLYYNDYGTDGLSTKANSVYEMVKSMKMRGIPIDGVGLQMHWRSVGSTLTAGEVAENIRRLGELGLEVVISEMDVQLCKGGTIEDQRARFHDIVAACVSQPNCPAVTIWGITDKYSWLNSLDLGCTNGETPRPLLWDDDYQEKQAYDGVMDALLGR